MIFMKLPLVTVAVGFAKFTLLNALKASKRNWTFCLSVKRKSLCKPKSVLKEPGPR